MKTTFHKNYYLRQFVDKCLESIYLDFGGSRMVLEASAASESLNIFEFFFLRKPIEEKMRRLRSEPF